MDIGSAVGRAAGVTAEQISALPNYRDSSAFNDLERLVIAYAEQMTRTPVDVPEEMFAELRRHFDDAQIVELSAEIAWVELPRAFQPRARHRSAGILGRILLCAAGTAEKDAGRLSAAQARSQAAFRLAAGAAGNTRSCAPSCSSSQRLFGSPPPKPVRLPSLPITRWHGTTIATGFAPLAVPTARTASG